MTYTVKAGDTLSQILKNLGVSSFASPNTWNLVKTASGSPHLIRTGETLNLSGVKHLMPGQQTTQTTAAVSKPATVAPSQQIAQTVDKEVAPPKPRFEERFGHLNQFVPEAAITQFAAQQVNPYAFRNMVRQMQDYERGLGTSGAWRTGYGGSGRTDLINQLEQQRKEMMAPFIAEQTQRFEDWYGAEKKRYETTDDPAFSLERAGLGGVLGGAGYAPSSSANKYTYQPLDLTKFLTPSSSGYGAAPLNQLYGTIK